jgi:polygalacturonase
MIGECHTRRAALAGLALALWGAAACGSSRPAGTGAMDAGMPDDAAAGGGDDAARPADTRPDSGTLDVSGVPTFPTACDDIGDEPTIPAACATLLATRSSAGGPPMDETTLDTQMIQAAIDACPAGQAVQLAADTAGGNDAFLSGALMLRAGVTLWIDEGVTLFASRNPMSFDVANGRCGGNNTGNGACYGLVNASGVAGAGLMGTGTLDGRGGEVVIGDATGSTWWQLEQTDQGNLAAPRLVQTTGATNFTLYKVTLRNSPKFHVVIQTTMGFKVWGITINTPGNSPNTDGIDPSASSNGVIAYNKISTGDDNIAIKGSGPPIVDNLVIAHNHFGKGHGMSIGSETYGGVQNVRVCDLSLDGSQNGLRIKSDSSRGGVVQMVSYTDVCMRGVSNPMVFDAYYSSSTGTRYPDYRSILARNVHVLGGGRVTFRGYDGAHPLVVELDNVVFDAAPTIRAAQDTYLELGPGPAALDLTGADVAVANQVTGTDPPRVCDDAWVTF